MNDAMVSVIVPLYNVEQYVHTCLDSLIKQTCSNIEIICIDDGSTDATCKIVGQFMEKDHRIRLFSQQNQGAGRARNYGMEYATGKYLYFFDGDDWCEETLLEKAVAQAEATMADVVAFDYYRYDQQTGIDKRDYSVNTKLYDPQDKLFSYKDAPDCILSLVNPTPWNKLYNRSFVMNAGLQFAELSSTNDITFCALSVAVAKKVSYLKEPLMHYRVNRTASTTSMKQKKLQNVILAVEAVVDKALALPYGDEITPSILLFSVANLIHGLKNYAGDIQTSYYKDYYISVQEFFKKPLYDQVTPEILKYPVFFDGFTEVKNLSYEEKKKKECVQPKEKEEGNDMGKLKTFILKKLGILSLKNKVQSLEKENKELKKQTEKLKEQYNTNRAELRKKIADLETKNVNFTKKMAYLDEQFVKMRRDNEAQHRALLKQISNLETYIFSQNRGLSVETREPKIIVSVTSYPARITAVPVVIERMLVQTVRADKILLWLSKDQFPGLEADLPEQLLDMRKDGLEIKWCEGDLKAYKKVLPALEQYPDDLIIIIDDDLIYRTDFIENLYVAHLKHPDAVIASRVHQIAFDENGKIAPYAEWKKECEFDVDQTKEDWFFTGGAGTLFPPHIFDGEVQNKAIIQELCPLADDIWLNINAAMRNVPIVNIANNNHLTYVDGTQEECLWTVNQEQNDVQLHKLLEHYKDRLAGTLYGRG